MTQPQTVPLVSFTLKRVDSPDLLEHFQALARELGLTVLEAGGALKTSTALASEERLEPMRQALAELGMEDYEINDESPHYVFGRTTAGTQLDLDGTLTIKGEYGALIQGKRHAGHTRFVACPRLEARLQEMRWKGAGQIIEFYAPEPDPVVATTDRIEYVELKGGGNVGGHEVLTDVPGSPAARKRTKKEDK